MKALLSVICWVLTVVTAFLLAIGGVALSSGQVLPLACFLLALVFVLPPLQALLRSKLPLLKVTAFRLFAWVALVIAGLAFGTAGSPFLSKANLCETPQEGLCQQDNSNFVKNTQKLYFTGVPQHLEDGTPVRWELIYRPEPDKKIELEAPLTNLAIKDGKAQLEFAPKTLAVGGYELRPRLESKNAIALPKFFTVWDSKQDVEDRKAKKLKDTPTKLSAFVLCDPASDNACKTDVNRFKADTKAIAFGIDVKRAQDGSKLKLVWKYLSAPDGKELVISTSTQQFDQKTGQVKYTLNSQSALPPGKYELLVALEAQNAEPIRREFTVQKAES